MQRISRIIALGMAVVGLVRGSVRAAEVGTAFTYQGELVLDGTPVNGTCDFQFSLFSAKVNGSQNGQDSFSGIPVQNGVFTVELDFGTGEVFSQRRWLEIAVQCSGDASPLTLSPRQEITATPLALQTRGIFVDDAGNVGIGTTDPDVTLHVEGPILSGGPNGGDIGARNPTNETAGVGLGWVNDLPRIRIGGEGAGTANGFAIQTVSNRSLLRILNNGAVGIGTTAPEMSLHATQSSFYNSPAVGGSKGDSHAYLHVSTNDHSIIWNDGSDMRFGSETERGSGYTEHVRITSRGRVGIGTTDPGATLHVVGSGLTPSLHATGFALFDHAVAIGRLPLANLLEVEGNASKSVAGSWLANSDRRIKKSVETVRNALDTLDKVRLVSFKYTDAYRAEHAGVDSRRYLNVIAQEFAEVFPDYVKGSGEHLPDGSEILQVDAYPLTIYAAAAVQELHAEAKEKGAEIAALTARLAKVETLVAKLAGARKEAAE